MGVRFVCDGCGEMMEPGAEPKRLGKVIRREYCECCVGRAEEYVAHVDHLHNEIAVHWKCGFDLLKREAHNDGLDLLPDSTSKPQERDRDHEVEGSA